VHVGHDRVFKNSAWAPKVGLELGRMPLAMGMDEAFNPAG